MDRRQFLANATVAGVAAGGYATSSFAAEADRVFRVAVIGHTGRGDYGHGLNTMWLSLPETKIVAVADANEAALGAMVKKLNAGEGFTDYRTMLAKTKPEIIAIGMRHVDQHRDVTMAAIEAGVQGIYMEKPFCRTLTEADEMVAACERKNVKLALAHRNRYHPVLPVVQQLMKDGALGRVLELRARGKEDPRGGALDLWVLGSHLLNLICFLGGKPLSCSATVLQDGRPITASDVKDGAEGIGPLAGNAIHARFEMECGVPAFFDSVQNAGTKQAGFGLQVIGTKGIIDLRVDQEPLAHFVAGNPFQPTKESRTWVPISTAGIGKPEPMVDIGKQVMSHWTAGRDLVAAIRENRPPLCSHLEGRTIMEMIAAVFESQRLNGQRVALPLEKRDNPLTRLG